jgi:hypothetical protein
MKESLIIILILKTQNRLVKMMTINRSISTLNFFNLKNKNKYLFIEH